MKAFNAKAQRRFTLYTGRTWLPALGLYDYRQRLYDPAVGRFLTPDPAQDPANLGNPYTYTANNPHAFVDPYGEWGWDNDWVQTGLEIFGAGCVTGRGGAARSFWMDSGGEQLRGMAQGAGVILGGDLGTAYEGMVAEAAASYETRIALHSATNGGDVNEAIATATGWRMVGADLVGFTGLAEAGSGVDYTTGGILAGHERLQRGLVGGSQLAGTVAMVGSTLSRGYAVAARGVVARTAVAAPAVDAAGQIAEVHQVLTQAAGRALRAVGPGKGHVWGTKVHGAFSTEVKQLQRPELLSERSFRVGERADYGVKGSVRVDVLYGTMENPIAVYDLKLNTSRLSARRIAQIQSHLPGTAAIPVIEVRP